MAASYGKHGILRFKRIRKCNQMLQMGAQNLWRIQS